MLLFEDSFLFLSPQQWQRENKTLWVKITVPKEQISMTGKQNSGNCSMVHMSGHGAWLALQGSFEGVFPTQTTQAENCHREHHPTGVPPAPPHSVVSTGKGPRQAKLVLAGSGQGSRPRLWLYGRMQCHVRLPVLQHWIFWGLSGYFAIPLFIPPALP